MILANVLPIPRIESGATWIKDRHWDLNLQLFATLEFAPEPQYRQDDDSRNATQTRCGFCQ